MEGGMITYESKYGKLEGLSDKAKEETSAACCGRAYGSRSGVQRVRQSDKTCYKRNAGVRNSKALRRRGVG